LELLAAGASREEILADYPLLEPEDITAALEYAARQSDQSGAAQCLMLRLTYYRRGGVSGRQLRNS
jgi:hypothetical protein